MRFPFTVMVSVAGSALSPIVIFVPLTLTSPFLIRSSAFRREQYPACEISFCTRCNTVIVIVSKKELIYEVYCFVQGSDVNTATAGTT